MNLFNNQLLTVIVPFVGLIGLSGVTLADTLKTVRKSPPIASMKLSVSEGDAPLTVSLDARPSADADGQITKYNWSSSDGQQLSGRTQQITFDNADTYTITLTVTDNDGLISKAEKTVTVTSGGGIPPTAEMTVSATEGEVPLTIFLDGSRSADANGQITEYHWSSTDGQQLSGKNQSITFNQAGTYTITLTVKDNDGLTSTAQKTITVNPDTIPPVAKMTLIPSSGQVPLTVNLSAQSSYDSDGTIDDYRWTLPNEQQLSGIEQQITIDDVGTYTITLTVTDNEGVQSTTHQTVTVDPKPIEPVPPIAKMTVSATQGEAPFTVFLDGRSSSDEDGTITDYVWTTTDGQQQTGSQTEITFKQQGSYTITLTVTDNDNLEATAQQSVTVFLPEPPSDDGPGQALIICGPTTSEKLFPYSNEFSEQMYQLLKMRGYSHDQIHYMNIQAPDTDLDDRLEPEYQDYRLFDPEQELSEVFDKIRSKLKPGDQFVFYLHGHASQNRAKILDRYDLEASHLRDLLATLPDGVQQIIIIDACYSGSFMDELAGPNRIIVTSSDDKSQAWQASNDSFSNKFLKQLRSGSHIAEAFELSRQFILDNPELFSSQKPWLDDDGDGRFSEEGSYAANIYIGKQRIHQASAPTITRVHPYIALPDKVGDATLWVETSVHSDEIYQVRAILLNPSYQPNQYLGEDTDFSRIELAMTAVPETQHYEANYNGFCAEDGSWKIRYQAQDKTGAWSDVETAEVTTQNCSLPAAIHTYMNQSRYTADEQVRLEVEMNGDAEMDLYIGIVFPDGYFLTVGYGDPIQMSEPNHIQIYQPNVKIAGQKSFLIMKLPLPPGIPTGPYQICGVLVEADSDPNDRQNWIHLHCSGVEVY